MVVVEGGKERRPGRGDDTAPSETTRRGEKANPYLRCLPTTTIIILIPRSVMATPSHPSTPSKPRRPSSSLPAHPRRARAASALETPGANAFVLHQQGLASIRTFLKGRSSYDVFPVSFRLIVLDTKLTVKKALGVMLQTGAFRRASGFLCVSFSICTVAVRHRLRQTQEG